MGSVVRQAQDGVGCEAIPRLAYDVESSFTITKRCIFFGHYCCSLVGVEVTAGATAVAAVGSQAHSTNVCLQIRQKKVRTGPQKSGKHMPEEEPFRWELTWLGLIFCCVRGTRSLGLVSIGLVRWVG